MAAMTQAATAATAAGRRDNKSFRIWDGSLGDLKHAAEGTGSPWSTLVGDAVEALLLRYIRCNRCSMPVPVKIGDCSGVDLCEAVADAVRAVYAQRCWAYEGVGKARRPAHQPVIIGADTAAGSPPAGSTGRKAAMREKAPAARTEPPGAVPPPRAGEEETATLVFLPPVPHAVPVTTHPVPEVPRDRRKKGRR
jgi:hypothetical protein